MQEIFLTHTQMTVKKKIFGTVARKTPYLDDRQEVFLDEEQ